MILSSEKKLKVRVFCIIMDEIHSPVTLMWPPVKSQNNHLSQSGPLRDVQEDSQFLKVLTGMLSQADSSAVPDTWREQPDRGGPTDSR
jgi:hypothetical protein